MQHKVCATHPVLRFIDDKSLVLLLLLAHLCALQRYCKDNPSRFHNADGAYMLSFAIIMLNTGRAALCHRRCRARCVV